MAEKDMTEKELESFNEVFSDIVNNLVFQGNQRMKENELEQAKLRSVYKGVKGLREQERDAVKYWKNANVRIACVGMENETEPEKDTPLRVIGYDGAAYRDQLYYVKDANGKRKKNNNPRYPVITLLLYFGYEKHWDQPLTLYDSLADFPEELREYVNDYKVNLFEIAWLTDEQLERFHSDFYIVADYFVQMRKNKKYVPSKRQIVHVREMLQLMTAITKDKRFAEVYDAHNAELEKGAEIKYMSEVLDLVENRGIEKGRKEGKKEGKKEGRKEGKKEGRKQGRKEGRQEGRILEYIDIRREDGYSEEQIRQGIIRKFKLTEEAAGRYLKKGITVSV